MDFHSSDDEYFDTCSDLMDSIDDTDISIKDEPKNSNECITPQSSLSAVPVNVKNPNNNDSKIGPVASPDPICDHQDIKVPFQEEYKTELSDSSDSESLLDELANEIKPDDDVDKVETEDSPKVEKSNEELQLEERVKLESLLSEEQCDELRQKSLSMKDDGNAHFKLQSFEAAIESYNNAIATCPLKYNDDHAIFYANRGTALAKLDKTDDSIKDLSIALDLKPDYLKALVRRAELRERTDKLSEALEDYRAILKIDPRNWAALHAEQVSRWRGRFCSVSMRRWH